METSPKVLARRERWRRYYYRTRDYHLQRGKEQYWREKETKYEVLRKRNTKAVTRRRFGVDDRLEFIKSRGNKCENCSNPRSLVIHHIDNLGRRSLDEGKVPNNSLENLMVLCKRCHTGHHIWGWQLKMKV